MKKFGLLTLAAIAFGFSVVARADFESQCKANGGDYTGSACKCKSNGSYFNPFVPNSGAVCPYDPFKEVGYDFAKSDCKGAWQHRSQSTSVAAATCEGLVPSAKKDLLEKRKSQCKSNYPGDDQGSSHCSMIAAYDLIYGTMPSESDGSAPRPLNEAPAINEGGGDGGGGR